MRTSARGAASGSRVSAATRTAGTALAGRLNRRKKTEMDLDEPCLCNHAYGEHTKKGRCTSCKCVMFRSKIKDATPPPVVVFSREQDLLEANTRLVEDRRNVDLHAMVRQFHRTGDYPVRHSPQVPSEDEIRFRLRLIAEEFFEQFECVFHGALQKQLVEDAMDRIRQVIDSGLINDVDLEGLVDAWADLKYVIVGSEVQFGVDGNAVFRVVHEANMAKFGEGAHRDKNGKTAKPPGWQPPDISGELERQRREEAKRS
jgi:predicted HAD superfamily Cof-like phosphohydrolase